MSTIKSRSELKNIFVDGCYPDQQDVHTVLDSYVHKDDLIPADRFENLQEFIAEEARQAAEEAVEPCHCQPCQPHAIALQGSRFNIEERTEEYGGQEGQQSSAVSVTQSSITFLAPADLADRLIAILADGKALVPRQLLQQNSQPALILLN